MANRATFQNLLAKFRPCSNRSEVLIVRPSGSLSFSTGIRRSWVSVAPAASVNRRASAP